MEVIHSKNWIQDIKFNLYEILKVQDLIHYERFSDFSQDIFEMMLEEAKNISQDKLYAVNRDGDKTHAKLVNGHVIMPESYQTIWKEVCNAGWQSMAASREFGGGGLPYSVALACAEIIQAANPTLFLFAGLSSGAGRLIENFASDELKEQFVEKMYSGIWTGTMCLTEPQAGSDLNLVKTKAVRFQNQFKISGNKIFITCGDHNLAENIIHLVLARIDGAPEGTAGISLFAVPKFITDSAGKVSGDNHVKTIAIEDKMGFCASPTCALNFDESLAYLVGEENKGLAQMFQMMNEARILVGSVSLSIAAQAYDFAIQYANERVQGAKISDRKGGPVPIIEHEDVRRMLIHMKAICEGVRALVLRCGYYSDLAENHPDSAIRESSHDLLSLWVPMAKSYSSDKAWEICRDAIQIFGGYGFIREYPVEQYARDSKINSIWEGTNYIQSADLLFRKLTLKQGSVVMNLYQQINAVLEQAESEGLSREASLIKKQMDVLGAAIQEFLAMSQNGQLSELSWLATRFLDSMSEIVIAYLLLEQMLVAKKALAEKPQKDLKDFYEGKIIAAQYFISNLLPMASTRIQSALKGTKDALNCSKDIF